MKRIEARIKTSFGEVVIEGENPQEILDMLGVIPENFVEKLSDFVSNKLTPSGAQLKGIVESTTEGPVIVTRENLTHYEAVGLVLYATQDRDHRHHQQFRQRHQIMLRDVAEAEVFFLETLDSKNQIERDIDNQEAAQTIGQGHEQFPQQIAVQQTHPRHHRAGPGA